MAHLIGTGHFPAPLAVAKTLSGLLKDNILQTAVLISLRRIIIGYSISVSIGLLFALILLKFKDFKDNVQALFLGIQTLPSISWVPLATMWFGMTELSITFVIVVSSTFAITLAIQAGIDNVNLAYVNAAKSMGAKGLKVYWYVIFPAALPSVISGLKQGWAFAWKALIAAEMMGVTRGLGRLLMQGKQQADINRLFAVTIVIIAIGLVANGFLFETLENSVRNKWGLSNTQA